MFEQNSLQSKALAKRVGWKPMALPSNAGLKNILPNPLDRSTFCREERSCSEPGLLARISERRLLLVQKLSSASSFRIIRRSLILLVKMDYFRLGGPFSSFVGVRYRALFAYVVS